MPVSILSCMELHRGSGPRRSLHGALRLHLHVNDILETVQQFGTMPFLLRVLLVHNRKQLAVVGRGEQDWRCAAFGASLAQKHAQCTQTCGTG
jgi:hypothetical protein